MRFDGFFLCVPLTMREGSGWSCSPQAMTTWRKRLFIIWLNFYSPSLLSLNFTGTLVTVMHQGYGCKWRNDRISSTWYHVQYMYINETNCQVIKQRLNLDPFNPGVYSPHKAKIWSWFIQSRSQSEDSILIHSIQVCYSPHKVSKESLKTRSSLWDQKGGKK